MALGAFVSGWVVDTYGPQNGFWVSVGAAILACAIVLLGQKTLAGPSEHHVVASRLQSAE